MKVISCLVLGLCVLTAGWSQAGPGADRIPAVFELSTEMVRFDAPSTELFLGWQRDVNSAIQLGMDVVSGPLGLRQPDRWLPRAGFLALVSGVSLVVNQAFSLTAHDQRHMETARAIGSTNVGLVTNDAATAPMGIGQFFLEAFNFTVEPGLYTYDPPASVTNAQEASVAGAGLDTNLYTASQIARKIDRGEGHVAELSPYLVNKLWGIHYFMVTGSTSDAQDYMDLLQAQGAGTVTQQNVIALHAVSCLLSGGFLGLARGTWEYLATGDPIVRPLELDVGPARVFWPEVTTWLNGPGVSVQAMVDAAWGERLLLRAGADVPVLAVPGAAAEVTLGASVLVHTVRVGAVLTTSFSGMPFVLGTLEIPVDERFSVGFAGYYGKGTTMREMREYPLGPGARLFLEAAL